MKKTRPANRRFRLLPRVYQALATCSFLVAVLSACSESDIDASVAESDQSGFNIPQGLQRATFPAGGSITAFVTIDSDQREGMKISNGKASFSKKLTSGTHEVLVEMLYESAAFSSAVPLITAKKTINTSSADGKTIAFAESDFTYADSDGDAYTNVREIEAGSNPNASGSTPSDGDDNYEENDQFDFAYDVSGMEGVTFDKALSTGQGYVTVEDGYDLFKITLPSSRATLQAEFVVTNGIFGGLLYLDASNNAVPGVAQEVDSGSDQLRKFLWTITNPGARDYYLVIGPGPEDTETPVAGGYFMKWFSTQ